MKLKLKGTLHWEAEVRRVFEEDTPMAIGVTGPWSITEQAARGILRDFFYWRLDDPEFNLLEVNVDIQTGALAGIAIPLYNGALHDLITAVDEGSAQDAKGIPRVDMDPWTSIINGPTVTKYFSVPGRCRFELGAETLRVALFPEPVSFRVSINDALLWEFNEQAELCAFVVKRLEEPEIAAIRSYVSRKRN